jgi:dTDP-4-amino-4,6-dideoxygalactose transaminase
MSGRLNKMDKIPLCRMFVDDETKQAVIDVLESGWYVKGNNAMQLEDEFAKFCNAKFGISASSGTSALLIALMAMDIGPNDEVIVPSATFVATVNPLILLGATPVFADIDPKTNTIDPIEIKKIITPKTKAIMPVHLYGHPANMQMIMEIAKEHDLKVVDDACQAHGATAFGHSVGTIGDITCFSFFPSKNMTVAGEGGIITTNNEELANKMQMIKNHGRSTKHTSTMLGLNLRLSEIHAAIGRIQLKHLADWVEARRRSANHYNELLKENDSITIPYEMTWARHAYYVYVIKTKLRDELAEYLKSKDIQTGVHYPIPVHKQPYILKRFPEVTLPHAEKWADSVLSLPLDPQLSETEIDFVVNEINYFTKG